MYNQIVLIIHLFCFVNISIIIIEGADKSLNVYNFEIGDDIFKKFGNDGKMTFEQFPKALKDFKIVVSEEHRQEAFNEMKKEGEDYITRSAFENYGIVNLTYSDIDSLKMAYNRMNANKRGEIGKRKLSKFLIDKLGDNYNEDVAEKMIKDICSPGKRYILFMGINNSIN